jgi:hypothetical protein
MAHNLFKTPVRAETGRSGYVRIESHPYAGADRIRFNGFPRCRDFAVAVIAVSQPFAGLPRGSRKFRP